jgi:hypothetical protein
MHHLHIITHYIYIYKLSLVWGCNYLKILGEFQFIEIVLIFFNSLHPYQRKLVYIIDTTYIGTDSSRLHIIYLTFYSNIQRALYIRNIPNFLLVSIFYLSLFFTYLYFLPVSIFYLSLFFTYLYFLPISIFYLSLFFTYLYFLPISIFYLSLFFTCLYFLPISIFYLSLFFTCLYFYLSLFFTCLLRYSTMVNPFQ